MVALADARVIDSMTDIELGVLEDHYAALDDLPPRYRTFDTSSEKVLIVRPLQDQSRDS